MGRTAGTYTPPASSWYPAVNGASATFGDWNALLTDISNALTQSLSLDGQSTPTANLPMGGFRLINVGAAVATTDAATLADVNSKISQINTSPFRNRIINGNYFEDQRNAAAAQTITAGANWAYTVDRMAVSCTGANVTNQQITAADGTKRARTTGAASVTAVLESHRIEAANSVDMAGNVCTLSQKHSNSLLTTVSWAVYYANSTDTFGTVASPTRTLIASGTWTVNSTEALYTAQVNVPSAATTGIEIVTSVGAQTSGTWTRGELEFEKGAIPAAAVSFERVDAAMNKARCQRYYQVLPAYYHQGGGYALTGNVINYSFSLLATMRVAPTFGLGTFAGANVSAYTVAGTNTNGYALAIAIAATGTFLFASSAVSTASAEL